MGRPGRYSEGGIDAFFMQARCRGRSFNSQMAQSCISELGLCLNRIEASRIRSSFCSCSPVMQSRYVVWVGGCFPVWKLFPLSLMREFRKSPFHNNLLSSTKLHITTLPHQKHRPLSSLQTLSPIQLPFIGRSAYNMRLLSILAVVFGLVNARGEIYLYSPKGDNTRRQS